MKTIIMCTEFSTILSKAQNRIRLIEWTKQIVRTKLVKGLSEVMFRKLDGLSIQWAIRAYLDSKAKLYLG